MTRAIVSRLVGCARSARTTAGRARLAPASCDVTSKKMNAPPRGGAFTLGSDPCFGEIWRTRRKKALAQIVPPGERKTGHVERQIDFQCEMRSPGGGNRRAESARDQIATAGTDRTDKSERSGAFNSGRIHSECPIGFARALRFPKLLLTEDRRNHPIGRAVADTGGDEQNEEHRQEPGEVLSLHEVHDADRGR